MLTKGGGIGKKGRTNGQNCVDVFTHGNRCITFIYGAAAPNVGVECGRALKETT